MWIKIDTPIARMSVDLTEDQVAEILGIALDYAVGYDPSKSSESKTTSTVVGIAPAPAEPVQSKATPVPEIPARAEYKGFLYLQCKDCGKMKGFMPKTPISKYHCDCGSTTYLNHMRVMRVECKCGQKFKYLTNALDNMLSIDCLNCGSPIDLEFHERKQEYVTIGSE